MTQVEGWGLVTHKFVASNAIDLVDANWKAVFDYYDIEILQGVIVPDTVWQNWDDHLYYPDNPTLHNGPSAILASFNQVRANFTNGDWSDGFFQLGITVHYMGDMNIPIHTGPLWSGDTPDSNPLHAAYERDVNSGLSKFNLSPRNAIKLNASYTVEDLAKDQAINANQYYNDVVVNYQLSSSDAVFDNTTLFSITEGQLEEAVFSIATVYKAAIEGFSVPELPKAQPKGKIAIDNTHSNDYMSNDDLSQFADDMGRSGHAIINMSSQFSSSSIADATTLVITAPRDDFTDAEIKVIASWLDGGSYNVILTSRGDFSDRARNSINKILTEIGSQIQVNDDNIYTTNPEVYKPHYIVTEKITASKDVYDLTVGVGDLQFFSPSSLYFTSTDENLTILAYADVGSYQTDKDGTPSISKVWDDTKDNTGGDKIPLAAVEIVGDDRIVVFGTTLFSDFDYGNYDQENIVLLSNIISWFDKPLFPEETTSETSSSEAETKAPISIIPVILGITVIALFTYNNKRKK